jgi:hypothetical protein
MFTLKAFEILENQNIFNKINSLSASNTWLDENMETYKQCDKLITQSMIIAENQTCQLKVTPWSPTFAAVVMQKSFWKIALSLKINHMRPNPEPEVGRTVQHTRFWKPIDSCDKAKSAPSTESSTGS